MPCSSFSNPFCLVTVYLVTTEVALDNMPCWQCVIIYGFLKDASRCSSSSATKCIFQTYQNHSLVGAAPSPTANFFWLYLSFLFLIPCHLVDYFSLFEEKKSIIFFIALWTKREDQRYGNMLAAIKEEKSRLNNNNNDNIFHFFLEFERSRKKSSSRLSISE